MRCLCGAEVMLAGDHGQTKETDLHTKKEDTQRATNVRDLTFIIKAMPI